MKGFLLHLSPAKLASFIVTAWANIVPNIQHNCLIVMLFGTMYYLALKKIFHHMPCFQHFLSNFHKTYPPWHIPAHSFNAVFFNTVSQIFLRCCTVSELYFSYLIWFYHIIFTNIYSHLCFAVFHKSMMYIFSVLWVMSEKFDSFWHRFIKAESF